MRIGEWRRQFHRFVGLLEDDLEIQEILEFLRSLLEGERPEALSTGLLVRSGELFGVGNEIGLHGAILPQGGVSGTPRRLTRRAQLSLRSPAERSEGSLPGRPACGRESGPCSLTGSAPFFFQAATRALSGVYLLSLTNVLGVDLASAIESKMAKDRSKYPTDHYRGRFRIEEERPGDSRSPT